MRHQVQQLRTTTVLGTFAALAAGAAFGGALPAIAQTSDEDWARAVGSNGVFTNSERFARFGLVCSADPCAAKMTMTVSAATRAKLGLKSAVVAQGSSKKCGEGVCLILEATKAVRAKFKAAKSVPVTYRLAATSPVQETVTKKVVVTAGSRIERFFVGTSGDPFSPR
jgi:hypothetical protein